MTREEAINVLNDYDINFERHTAEEIAEAHEIAIKAIRTIPSEDEKIIRIKKGTLKARTGRYVIYDVEWLKTHFNTTEAKIYGQPQSEERTETHECDCISRKDIGLTNLEILMCNGDYKEALKMLLDKIEKAPSVNPQQKTGHWIEHKSDGYTYIKCSECSCYFPRRLLPINKYCPECGAKMQEVQE